MKRSTSFGSVHECNAIYPLLLPPYDRFCICRCRLLLFHVVLIEALKTIKLRWHCIVYKNKKIRSNNVNR